MPTGFSAPLLIIETGRPLPSLRRHGGFPHWIRTAAGLPRAATVTVDVESGAPLPAHAGFAGAIVTGSGAMVTERRDWSERAATWLADAAGAGLPLLGICYGHQLLAHALGGEVGDNPGGREMGTVVIDLLPAADDDPLFTSMPAAFAAQATHRQSVLRPPADATVLAGSALDSCQAFRWGKATWGVQFHPEFSATHMRGYIRGRADALVGEGRDWRALWAAVAAAPQARRLLRRFARHARAAAGG